MSKITQKQLKKFLSYNAETGIFAWKVKKARSKEIGEEAGWMNNGYIFIGLFGKLHAAHRLAWLYVTGEWPADQIDRVDHNRANNKWGNLRAVSRSENMKNSKKCCRNTSGFTGVKWHKANKYWIAVIHVDGTSVFLGCYNNKNDAISARKTANKKYGFHKNHRIKMKESKDG